MKIAALAILSAAALATTQEPKQPHAMPADDDHIVTPASPPQPFDPVSFLSLERIDTISVSADGRARAVSLRKADWEEDEFVESIALLGPDGRLDRRLELPGSPDSFAWSPQGDLLALDLKDEDTGFDQVFLYDPQEDSLQRLTDHPRHVRSIRWGPQGRWVYYLADDAPDAVEAAQRELTHIVEPYYGSVEHRHLWRAAVDTGERQRLTGGRYSVRDYDVGESGALLIRRAREQNLDAAYESEVWVAESAQASFVRVTRNDHPESDAVLSPNQAQAAWRARATLEGAAYVQEKVFIHDLHNGEVRNLIADAYFEVDGLAWTKDGRALVLEANAGLRSTLILADAESGVHRPLSIGEHRVIDWDFAADENVAYAVLADTTSLADVWRMPLDGGDPERLTYFGSDALAGRAVPRQEQVNWRSTDGQEIEGLYVFPLNASDDTPAPMVVFPHGGPRLSDQFDSVLRASKYAPVFSANGYGVLFINYRGGIGYGDAFMRGMHKEYFRIAHQDVLAGVDAMIEEGRADPDHLVMMGWSAGGHMVNKIITETDRFAAAFSGAGVVDFAAHHLTSDTRATRRLLFDADVWEEDIYETVFQPQSLIGELHRVSTPTLIMTGEDDDRVHPSQSIMLYHALRRLNVETELYLLPGAGHSPRKPSHQLFRINAALDWFAEHRNAPRPVWVAPPVQNDEAALLRRGVTALVDTGAGAFLFKDWDGPALPVFFHVPENADADSPILMVAHGTRRNGQDYRDQWAGLSESGGFIVIAPQFGAADFPGSAGYNLGRVFDGDATRPEAQWAFSAIDPLFEAVRDALGSNRTGYTLYGHSAGSQFTHRHLFWSADSLAERHIAANAGWYTMPDWDIEFPYGLGGSGVDEAQMIEALQRDVVILLGSEDDDPDHASLRRTRQAMTQGPHRFARGQAFFEAARAQAEMLSTPFGWRLEVVDGAGHSNEQMAAGAARYVE